MQYVDDEIWIDKVELKDEWEKVLGGIDGPANRPVKQLCNRTAWLKRLIQPFIKMITPVGGGQPYPVMDLRIPIYEDVTLQVSTSGDDETGDLTHPFATPQAAIDYALSAFDFKKQVALTIEVAQGQYGRLEFRPPPSGIKWIIIEGENNGNTFFSNVVSHANCEITLRKIGLNGIAQDLHNSQIIAFTGASILLDTVSFFPYPDIGVNPIIAMNGGFIQALNTNLFFNNAAAFNSFFDAETNGIINISNTILYVNQYVYVNTGIAIVVNGGSFTAINTQTSEIVNGVNYYAVSGGRIITLGAIGNWGTVAGYNDGTAIIQ